LNLDSSKNALVKQYQSCSSTRELSCIRGRRVGAIAELAQQRKVGARGLRVIIEDLMLDLMFCFQLSASSRVGVTKEMVSSNRIDLSLLEKAASPHP